MYIYTRYDFINIYYFEEHPTVFGGFTAKRCKINYVQEEPIPTNSGG